MKLRVRSEATSFIIEALRHDPSPWVRANAVWTIAYDARTNAEAMTALIAAVSDDTEIETELASGAWRICETTAECLERMGNSPTHRQHWQVGENSTQYVSAKARYTVFSTFPDLTTCTRIVLEGRAAK